MGGRGGLDRCCGHLATLMTATSALKVFSGKPSVPATALNYSLAGIVVYHLLSGHLNVPGAELFRALFLRPAMNLWTPILRFPFPIHHCPIPLQMDPLFRPVMASCIRSKLFDWASPLASITLCFRPDFPDFLDFPDHDSLCAYLFRFEVAAPSRTPQKAPIPWPVPRASVNCLKSVKVKCSPVRGDHRDWVVGAWWGGLIAGGNVGIKVSVRPARQVVKVSHSTISLYPRSGCGPFHFCAGTRSKVSLLAKR